MAAALNERPAPARALARRRAAAAWLFLAPALAALALVAAWPLARTLGFAFTDATLASPEAAAWVGLDNFAYVLADLDWWLAVANTLVFALGSVTLELALGLWIALLLDARFRGRGGLRAAVLVPWAIPTVVAAQMGRWMFHDVYGVVNDLLLRLGALAEPVAWLARDGTAMLAIILTDVWKTTPFVALLLLAGLQTIPPALHEAAKVDGVSARGRLLHITLPLLKPAIAVALLFRMLDALRVFDLIYVMTANSRGTASVSVYARQYLIDFQDLGAGSAASVLVAVLVGMASVAILATLRPRLAAP